MNEESIFAAATKKRSPAEREAYLREACGADLALQARLAGLLRAYDQPDSFLNAPPTNELPAADPPGLAHTSLAVDASARIGSSIGPYKLRELLGEGGMGVVFVADQTEPVRRRVALKVIKPGMDTQQVIARFEAEKQALAMMDHPNIARIFDAGTVGEPEVRDQKSEVSVLDKNLTSDLRPLTSSAGRPYFVMELVRGMPITEYCDQTRLNPRQRLALFVTVCQAVQHAHQKGIIHRDIKPSNILVTLHDGTPVVKVIDFGVAKATTQARSASEGHSIYTALTQIIGTPLYMSPEQAEMSGLDVDTRSDVYSLGVLLYELLTGQTPFDKETLSKAGLDEMRRMIREDEPETVSTRLARTRGLSSRQTPSAVAGNDGTRSVPTTYRNELDWIVMKALEKDRSRRYESASAFATDIQRYLSDEPVLACPPTTMYRFQKFARKHKPVFVTAIAIAACLILGTTVSAWQAARATTAEAQANANEAQAKEAAAAEAQQRQRAEANEQKAIANAAAALEKEQEAVKQRDEVKALADKLAAKEQELQRTLYTAHMNLARHAWDAGAVDDVEELLQRHRPKDGEPDHRGFEWHYLHRLSHSELLTLRGHTGQVNQVVYSPDGKRLASASRDKTVKVWDASTGKELLTFAGHTGGVGGVAFSPDGARLASCGGGGLKVWNAQTGEELWNVREASSPVVYSPDGTQIATGYWSADLPGNKTVKIWDAQTGQELNSWKAVDSYIYNLAFSPDGKRLASGDGDQTVVFDAQTGHQLLSLKDADYGALFTPDGKRLVGGGFVWDAQSGEKLLTLPGVENFISISPDGRRLAARSNDRTLHIFDLETGEEIRTIKGGARAVEYSPDGRHLASYRMLRSSDYTVKIWDTEKDQDSLTVERTTGYNVAISPDGRYMATGENNLPTGDQTNLRIWDPRTGEAIRTFPGHTAAVHGVAFSPDGKRLASGGTGRAVGGGTSYGRNTVQELKIWDVQSGKELLSIQGQGLGVYSLAFSPDGKRVASTRKIWDAATGEELASLSGNQGYGQHVAFSPDGKYVVTGGFGYQGNANEVKLWNAKSGEEIRTLQGGGQGVAFSPDSKRVASAVSLPDQKVWVWDVESGRELYTVKGGGYGVTFSPDGKRLASGGKVWDAETGQELLSLKFHGYGIAFSPDGHLLACASGGGTIIWDATPLPEKP